MKDSKRRRKRLARKLDTLSKLKERTPRQLPDHRLFMFRLIADDAAETSCLLAYLKSLPDQSSD